MFLGTASEIMKTVGDVFLELGLQKKDCMEMSWIESVVYFSFDLRGQSIDALIERQPWGKGYFKVKSDYVKKPIPEEEFAEIWKWCLQENVILQMEPHVSHPDFCGSVIMV
ncbi:putative cannabidiolic acid synthase [Helianthus anomalus]